MFTLNEVVPWGRSFSEYSQMFALSATDLDRRILGCGDGPASFNAEATRRGGRVTSVDPMYALSESDILARISETSERVLAQTRANADEFVWDSIGSVEELGAIRLAAMGEFLEDYELGRAEGRYVDAALPELPFADASFELALCSHFLFLYTDQLGKRFHTAAVREMCRVAEEVRVFPLLAMGGTRSPYVDPCADDLRGAGCDVQIEEVPYEFQRGGYHMMRVRAS